MEPVNFENDARTQATTRVLVVDDSPVVQQRLAAMLAAVASIELVGQPRAIRPQRLDPACQFVLVAVGVAAPFHRAFQRVERHHQPPGGGIDVGRCRLGRTETIGGVIVHTVSADLPWRAA